jgi:hypothetical protein
MVLLLLMEGGQWGGGTERVVEGGMPIDQKGFWRRGRGD